MLICRPGSDEEGMTDEENMIEESLHEMVVRLFNIIEEKMVELFNLIEEKVVDLFNISDFLYSLFFGLLPSLMDITTDFSFADRFRYNT